MFNSNRIHTTLKLNWLVAVLVLWFFWSATAMAGDVFGIYRLDKKELATVAGKKHTMNVTVWEPKKEIIKMPLYVLKKSKNNRQYAGIEHDNMLGDKGLMVATDYSQKEDEKKVLGSYQLFEKDFIKASGKVYKNNIFVWLKKPVMPKAEIILVKSGNKITIVNFDRNQEIRQINLGLQFARKSID